MKSVTKTRRCEEHGTKQNRQKKREKMDIQAIIIKEAIKDDGALLRAATRAEERLHLLDRSIKDILDEIGDCFHDDTSFKRKVVNEIILRPDMKKKVAFKFISFIIQK